MTSSLKLKVLLKKKTLKSPMSFNEVITQCNQDSLILLPFNEELEKWQNYLLP